MSIKKRVLDIKNKYSTNNPIEIIESIGISLVFHPIGNVTKGLYQNEYEQPIILIDNTLSKEEQRLVAAHELGHYTLHPDMNIEFIKRKTFLCKDKFERQADIFAAELLLDDSIFEKYQGCTLQEISMSERVYPKFVEHKFNNL